MDKVIPVKSLNEEDTKGLDGCYVLAPGWKIPIYIPERHEDGTFVLPADSKEEEGIL